VVLLSILFAFSLKVIMLPILVHEAMPGHHYQYSYMLSKTNIPAVRQLVDGSNKDQSPFNFPSYTVYVEVSSNSYLRLHNVCNVCRSKFMLLPQTTQCM